MVKKTIQVAKITYPFLTGIFPRERLFRYLESSRERPIIWVFGPPGCGKTTLVASYLDAKKIPCLWYNIDEGDSDISTFFYYMKLAAKNIAPLKRKPLLLLTPEYLPGISTFTLRYFENLFSRLKASFTIVFDNYHLVPDESKFHEVISDGLSVIPENINAILISRRGPPPQFARLLANNKMSFLGWNEIRFTIDESRQISQMKAGKGLTDEILLQLNKKTEGWAAGLILMLEMAKIKNIDHQLLEKLTPKEIFEYFAGEIFDKTDKETQDFLLKTALLSKMTAPMAEKLTGIIKSGEILSDLHRNHYFTERSFSIEPSYQYHPLFREFLLSRAKGSFTPNELSLIQRSSAFLLEESGQVEDAAKLFCESRDFEGLARLVRKCSQSLVQQGRNQTLLEWLNFIPRKRLVNDPWLLYSKGTCSLPFNPAESLFYFEEAFRKFKAKQDATGTFLAWSGIIESILYGSEGLKKLDLWLPILDKLLMEFKGFPTEYIEANVLCSMIRALSMRRPTYINMDEWVERVQAVIRKSTDIPLRTKVLINLAGYYYNGGELQRLRIVIDSLSALLKHPGASIVDQLTTCWVHAAYLNMSSLYDDCQKVVSHGLALADATGIHVMDYMLMGHGALSSLKKGDFSTGKNYLSKMAFALSMAKPWEASFFHYIAAWEASYQRNMVQAYFHSEECLKLCEDTGNPWTLFITHLQRAFLYHESGEEKKAAECLAKAWQIGIQSKNEFTHFACLLAEAYFSLHRQEDKSALESLRKGMQIGREKGFFNMYMWLPGFMEKVATKALESGIEVTYVQDLIKRNALLPDTDHVDIECWPWPIKVYTLGGFKLVKDGEPIQFSRKVQQKPLTVLKAMIALGVKDVKEEQLTDLLWPEAEGDAAHSAFTTTLSRLRQLLGIEKAIKFQEGRLILDPCYCWVDAWAFERIFGEAEALWKDSQSKDKIKGALQLTEKTIGMYKGHFLQSDAENLWTASYRERLRNKFLRLILRLGNYMEQNEQWEGAVENFQRAIEIDDLAEEFYQHLMICYHRVGQQVRAIEVYRQCRNTLFTVLGVEPSSKTEAIYNSLCQ